MPDKVVIFLPSHAEAIARIVEEEGTLSPVVTSNAVEALQQLQDASGLLVAGSTYPLLFPQFKQRRSGLRWIQSAGSGYDVFEKLGVPQRVSFMRAVGVWGHSVAGHAVALTLALLRKLPALLDAQREMRWARGALTPGMRSVAGSRIVVLGYGDIGQIIAATFSALGAELVIIASQARKGSAGEDILALESLDAVLPDADALVMSLPLTPQTQHLINATRIERMRRDAVLVNVGRGETIDTAALATALDQGRLGGAALDVFEQEPLPANSPLWHCANLIVTPHVANLGDRRSGEKLAALILRNAKLIANGDTPDGLIAVPCFQ